MNVESGGWVHALRGISRATDERVVISSHTPAGAFGHSAPVVEYDDDQARAVASALLLANMNSLPLDWAARTSVGGTNLSFFIVKQLPILKPETYLEPVILDGQTTTWVEIIVPRVLELTYTSWELQAFALDLGYERDPFSWSDDRRHRLQSELDAAYALMYHLDRNELEWILDAQYPSTSFPILKTNEMKRFGEYRTQRYVLAAFDAMRRGDVPGLT